MESPSSRLKRLDRDLALNPELLSIALLDEIAERLLRLENIEHERNPKGYVDPIGPITVTHALTEMRASDFSPWFSVVVINDGPNDCWLLPNPDKNFTPHHLLSTEDINLNMERGLITVVHLWCDAGETAAIRMVGIR